MSRAGARIRAIAARFYGTRTMERLIEPALTDLQVEYEDAVRSGRKWQGRWLWTLGHIAFFRMIAVHAGERAMEILQGSNGEDRRALFRTGAFCVAFAVLGTVGLAAVPLLNVGPGTHPNAAMLAMYLVPQALPVSIPLGLTFGIIWGSGTTPAARRSRTFVLIAAAALSIVSFAMVAWVVPAANQAFRVSIVGGPVVKGANELTLGELGQLLEPGTDKPMAFSHPAGMRGLRLNYHTRWALACAPLVFASFALVLTHRRRRGRLLLGFAGCAAMFGYYVIMYGGRALELDRPVPAFTAAWAPNAAVLVVSLVIAKLGSLRNELATRP